MGNLLLPEIEAGIPEADINGIVFLDILVIFDLFASANRKASSRYPIYFATVSSEILMCRTLERMLVTLVVFVREPIDEHKASAIASRASRFST